MKRTDQTILVYFDDSQPSSPQPTGTLKQLASKGAPVFSFEYNTGWLAEKRPILDPDLQLFTGHQYASGKPNFGVFLDSMPDSWGRMLMKKKEAQTARTESRLPRLLTDADFLLGVFDFSRCGALRFKTTPDGPFLDHQPEHGIPPLANIRTIQHASQQFETGDNNQEWLDILLAPGSSLGGARPKANILDTDVNLWIAKFPSVNDDIDKGAWEYTAVQLAGKAGIETPATQIKKISGNHHTFLTKRFDRSGTKRIHMASAMTMTGNFEAAIRDHTPGYLELAEFIQFHGSHIQLDLHQLWRRIVFNILISNTDDHLRNHGFILENGGWRLSPVFDINPSTDRRMHALLINENDNTSDVELALSVIEYFQLNLQEARAIITDVQNAVKTWIDVAKKAGISRSEIERMAPAFKV